MNPYTPLDYELYEGNYFDPADKVLQDKMVKARKEHTCTNCKGPILPGTQYRRAVGIIEGEIHECKYCAECCAAMVQELKDLDDESIEHIVYHFEERRKPNQAD